MIVNCPNGASIVAGEVGFIASASALWISSSSSARLIAVLSAISDQECTRDLGGKLGTREFTQVVIDRLRDELPK